MATLEESRRILLWSFTFWRMRRWVSAKSALWQGREGCFCRADLSLRRGVAQCRGEYIIVLNITSRNVVSSGVAEITPKDFSPCRAGGWRKGLSKTPLRLSCKPLPVSLVEISVRPNHPRWRLVVTWEEDGYGELVRTKGC